MLEFKLLDVFSGSPSANHHWTKIVRFHMNYASECEPPEAATVTGCTDAVHYDTEVVLDIQVQPGWRIAEWSDDRSFDGDRRTLIVDRDLDLVVYLEEIEPSDD